MPRTPLRSRALPALRPRLLILVVAATLALANAALGADEFLNVRYNVDRSGAGTVRVVGTVTNEGRIDVLDVYVTAEALDGSGKVLGRGISYVSQSILQRTSASFVISVPGAQSAAGFRVRVSSYRPGLGVQSS